MIDMDSFLQFSFAIDMTEEEAKWTNDLVCAVAGYHSDDYEDMTKGDEIQKIAAEICDLDVGESIDVHFAIHKHPEGAGGGTYGWFFSEEGDEPYDHGLIVRAFLKRWREGKHQVVAFEWAAYGSKLRIGEFGGGCCVVTEEKITVRSTYDVMVKLIEEQDFRLHEKVNS